MSVREIKEATTQLPPKERAELVALLAEQHHQNWDRQIEDDLDSGRLDKFIVETMKEYDAGLAKPL